MDTQKSMEAGIRATLQLAARCQGHGLISKDRLQALQANCKEWKQNPSNENLASLQMEYLDLGAYLSSFRD